MTTVVETRTIYPSPDNHSIYVGTDQSRPQVWHFERSGNSYVIRPATDASKVISFEGINRPVLLDRPATITNKELFKIEENPLARGFISIKSVYFNKYVNVSVCYKNNSVNTYDIEVVNKDQCALTSPDADICLCISSFAFERQ